MKKLFKDMDNHELRQAYWTARNGLATTGMLAQNVGRHRDRGGLTRTSGRLAREMDIIRTVADRRGITLDS